MKYITKRILSITIILLIITALLTNCTSKKYSSKKTRESVALTNKRSNIHTNMQNTSWHNRSINDAYISYVDGKSVYIIDKISKTSIKIFEFDFPQNTFKKSIIIQNGKDYVEILASYYMSDDYEDGDGIYVQYIVNIHTKEAQLIPSSARMIGGKFINGTNKFMYDDYYGRLNIYDVSTRQITEIRGCSEDRTFSPDEKWCYFQSTCAAFDKERTICTKTYDRMQLLAYNTENDEIQNISSLDEQYNYTQMISKLSDDGNIIAYIIGTVDNGEKKLIIKNTKTFETISDILLKVPIQNTSNGLVKSYMINEMIISPSNDKMALIEIPWEPINVKYWYIAVIALENGKVIQKETPIDITREPIAWRNNNHIVIRKWNKKFNKDKGKKEKPYIERTINIEE